MIVAIQLFTAIFSADAEGGSSPARTVLEATASRTGASAEMAASSPATSAVRAPSRAGCLVPSIGAST
ncbi:MAG: hypothetical protein LKI24_16260 [Acidipropionibacterium sp.]|nr:hypothetical protein [Acidipropionibacterium sp.]